MIGGIILTITIIVIILFYLIKAIKDIKKDIVLLNLKITIYDRDILIQERISSAEKYLQQKWDEQIKMKLQILKSKRGSYEKNK
jgi:predicted Holliday junction resolvase-like endonuclease